MGADYKLPPVLELQLKDLNYTSEDIEEKISISILILDTSSPLPQRNARDDNEEDLSDAALYEVCQRQLRSTKCL